jgi:hypothetical protein
VNYRDSRGNIHQTTVDAATHDEAIVTAQKSRPAGRDFTAIKLSTRPL